MNYTLIIKSKSTPTLKAGSTKLFYDYHRELKELSRLVNKR